MLLLIDAYNLLHHSDALERGRGVGWLERARRRLVHRIAEHLDPALAAETCLVFDAQDPPRHLPHDLRVESIRLQYAVDYPEADDLIEELIARHPTPRRLTVVSSDHRIQRAAARRGATFFDADQWYDWLLTRGPQLAIPWPPPSTPAKPLAAAEGSREQREKPDAPATAAEVAQWYDHFALEPPESLPAPQPAPAPTPAPTGEPKPPTKAKAPNAKPKAEPQPRSAPESKVQPKAGKRASKPPPPRQPPVPRPTRSPPASPGNPNRQLDPDQSNPFPEGYGEDLEEGR